MFCHLWLEPSAVPMSCAYRQQRLQRYNEWLMRLVLDLDEVFLVWEVAEVWLELCWVVAVFGHVFLLALQVFQLALQTLDSILKQFNTYVLVFRWVCSFLFVHRMFGTNRWNQILRRLLGQQFRPSHFTLFNLLLRRFAILDYIVVAITHLRHYFYLDTREFDVEYRVSRSTGKSGVSESIFAMRSLFLIVSG